MDEQNKWILFPAIRTLYRHTEKPKNMTILDKSAFFAFTVRKIKYFSSFVIEAILSLVILECSGPERMFPRKGNESTKGRWMQVSWTLSFLSLSQTSLSLAVSYHSLKLCWKTFLRLWSLQRRTSVLEKMQCPSPGTKKNLLLLRHFPSICFWEFFHVCGCIYSLHARKPRRPKIPKKVLD